ncbi:10500_t:CDS:1, partial [Gigaspora margarita]
NKIHKIYENTMAKQQKTISLREVNKENMCYNNYAILENMSTEENQAGTKSLSWDEKVELKLKTPLIYGTT